MEKYEEEKFPIASPDPIEALPKKWHFAPDAIGLAANRLIFLTERFRTR